MISNLYRGCALALGIMLSIAPAARAEVDHHVLGTDGIWEVASGMDSAGNSYCSIQDQSADKTYALLMLIYPLGNAPTFKINVFKDTWLIPSDADVTTEFHFSNGSSWNATGLAEGKSSVHYRIDMKDVDKFLSDFSKSNSVDIVFVKGTEPSWTVDLSTTSQATADLLACRDRLLGAKSGATQPVTQ